MKELEIITKRFVFVMIVLVGIAGIIMFLN